MALPSLDNKNESDPTLLDIKKINIKNLSFNIEQSKNLSNINESMSKMYELAKAEADEARKQRGFELELLRESARKSNANNKPEKPDSSSEDSPSWIDMLGKAILVAISAYALGIDKYFKAILLPQTLKMFSKSWMAWPFKKLFSGLGKLISAPFKTAIFTKAFAPVSTAWKNFTLGFKNVGKVMGAIKAPVAISEFKTTAGKIGASIGKVLKPILDFFKTSKAFFSGGISKVGNFFKSIGGFFRSIGKVLPFAGKLLTLLKGVPVLGQVIAIVMGIFDFVTGFLDGFKKKGDDDERGILIRLWDGTVAGIINAFRGMFMIPLDLITKGVAWIAGKLGFDQVEAKMTAWLDGGGFTGMFDTLVESVGAAIDAIVDWFDLLFDDPLAALKTLAAGYIGMFMDFGGWVYKKAIAPIVDWIGTLFGAKEGETSKGIETWVGDKLNNIINFPERIYNKYIAPVIKWVSDLFGGGDEKGGSGGIKWPDLSAMMPDLPTWDNIRGKIGNLINNMMQGMAEMIDLPAMGAASRGIANLGASIAAGLGVTTVQKYKTSERNMAGFVSKEGGMETVDAKSGRVLTKKELDARTEKAADAKAAAANVSVNVVKGGDTTDASSTSSTTLAGVGVKANQENKVSSRPKK